jgi:capsular exopolysaccharide synthesis family protein
LQQVPASPDQSGVARGPAAQRRQAKDPDRGQVRHRAVTERSGLEGQRARSPGDADEKADRDNGNAAAKRGEPGEEEGMKEDRNVVGQDVLARAGERDSAHERDAHPAQHCARLDPLPRERQTGPDGLASLPPSVRDGLRYRSALASAHEAYRTIRSQILLSRAGEPPNTVLVTSAVPEEGKSITAVNTAITFAHKGRRVLLVDADLRRARCHELLQCDGRQGLSEVLTGQLELDDAVIATEVPNLFLLSAGAVPPDPPELLGSSKMNQLLKELEVRYEHVIIDSAPVMPISDSIVLSRHVDGVIVVVGRSTSKQLVKRACTRISDAGARLLGVVLNRVSAYHASYYPYNGYYHYYNPSRDRTNGTAEHAGIVFD